MANELGQPTAQEIAEKFCTEILCNALLCDGCPVQAIQHAAQPRVQSDICHESASSKHVWGVGDYSNVCIACGKCR